MSDDLLGGTTRARAAPAVPHVDFGADLDTGADAQDGGDGDPPADDLLSKKKVQQKRLTFKEAHLISEKGMWRLYEQMQRLPISRREGDEAADMLLISSAYRLWAQQLFPREHTSTVLAKCAAWSGRTLVKNVLHVMRYEIERVRASSGEQANVSRYRELTEQTRKAAEAEAEARKTRGKRARGDRTDIDDDLGADGAADEYEEEMELDITERRRAAEEDDGMYAGAEAGGGAVAAGATAAAPDEDYFGYEGVGSQEATQEEFAYHDFEQEGVAAAARAPTLEGEGGAPQRRKGMVIDEDSD